MTTYKLYSIKKTDPTYRHIWAFLTYPERDAFFTSPHPPVYTFSNNKTWRIGSPIKVSVNEQDLQHIDYAIITNGENVWYCFVTGVQWLSARASRITLSVDVIQTYYFWRYTDPLGGLNIIPFWEKLNYAFMHKATPASTYVLPRTGYTPEYSVGEHWCYMRQFSKDIGSTIIIYSTVNLELFYKTGQISYQAFGNSDMMLAAAPYACFAEGDNSPSDVASILLSKVNNAGITASITGVYSVPLKYLTSQGITASGVVTALQLQNYTRGVTVQRPVHCAEVTVQNDVLKGYGYSYMLVTNNQGDTQVFNFEDFDGTPIFRTGVSLETGVPVIWCYPQNLREGAGGEDRPIRYIRCNTPFYNSYQNDSFAIWAAQNAASQSVAIQSANMSIEQAKTAQKQSLAWNIEQLLQTSGAQKLLESGTKFVTEGMGELLDTIGMEGGAQYVKDNLNSIAGIANTALRDYLGATDAYVLDYDLKRAELKRLSIDALYQDKQRIPVTAMASGAYNGSYSLGQYGIEIYTYTPSAAWAVWLDMMISANGLTYDTHIDEFTKRHAVYDYIEMLQTGLQPSPDRPDYANAAMKKVLETGVYLWYTDINTADVSNNFGMPLGLPNPEVAAG